MKHKYTTLPALNRITLALLLSLSGLVPSYSVLADVPAGGQYDTQSYNIAAGSLPQVLNQFATQARIKLTYDTNSIASFPSKGLQGRYSVIEALSILLSDTNLRLSSVSGNKYLLRAITANKTKPVSKGDLDNIIVQATAATPDQKGYSEVYYSDIASVYIGKDKIDRYKGGNVADLFNDAVGVYSGDARNSGAIDPNIRGVQGQGYIPVTIDGTEQAITVWRGYAGASNRNYLDPNLISNIYIEKGASLNPNVKSSSGGAVAINTISAIDIIPRGQNFGIEVIAETSTNSTKPRMLDYKLGQDYRALPDGWNYTWGDQAWFDPSKTIVTKTKGQNKLFKDNSIRLSAAYKNDFTDIMLAYSYRDKGNYFAGKRGAKKYGAGLDLANFDQYKIDNGNYNVFMPYIALLIYPGSEVANTSIKTQSWLFKNNWYLPNNQKVSLGIRNSHITYGEIMSSHLVYTEPGKMKQWQLADVKQQAYNIGYDWNPENRFINLKSNLWYTHTDSLTNTAGGSPGNALLIDPQFERAWNDYYFDKTLLTVPSVSDKNTDGSYKYTQNTDGRFTIVDTSRSEATNKRWGLTLSNKMALHNKLDLVVMGDYQEERLDSDNYFGLKQALMPWTSLANSESAPRKGVRKEWNVAFNFTYRPATWLQLDTGARYRSYWSFDNGLQETFNKQQGVGSGYESGLNFDYYRVMTAEEYSNRDSSDAMQNKGYIKDIMTWSKNEEGWYKLDSSPFHNGSFDKNQQVVNPATGQTEAIFKQGLNASQTIEWKKITGEDSYTVKNKQGSGWAPAVAANIFVTDNITFFMRHTQNLRMPSIFQDTTGFSASSNSFGAKRLKPEHSYLWEIGYSHDLTGFIPQARYANLRFSYYNNITKNIIDRDQDFQFNPFDKHKQAGLELQARYDQGHFFADFGANYTIKNEVCDKTAQVRRNGYFGDGALAGLYPECFPGGWPGSYFRSAIQPEYAINANLGLRLLNEKLTLGNRLNYFSKVGKGDELEQKLLNAGKGVGVETLPFRWAGALVIDAYASYQLSKNAQVELIGTNLTNLYYQDPISRSPLPAPGRTFKLQLKAKF